MFEQAARLRLRFSTDRGRISVEDVWELPLQSQTAPNLDDIAKSLNKLVNESHEESFVVKNSNQDTVHDLKFKIVMHIIEVRLAEAEARENAIATKARKEKIMAIIEEKEDDKLKGASLASLKKMVNEL